MSDIGDPPEPCCFCGKPSDYEPIVGALREPVCKDCYNHFKRGELTAKDVIGYEPNEGGF